MKLITHKSSIGRFPFKITFSWRKKYWYLFPQGCNWTKSVAEHTFCGEKSTLSYPNVYQHRFFGLYHKYEISWLFFNILFELVENPLIQHTQFKSEITADTEGLLKLQKINFNGLHDAIRYLQALEKTDVDEMAQQFALFSQQEIAHEIILKFKMSGLSKEDFLASDFLNRYGIKNLFQILDTPSVNGQLYSIQSKNQTSQRHTKTHNRIDK